MDNRYVSKIEEMLPEHITVDQDDISDPARVMKVPGTKGIKSDSGRLCGIIHEPTLSHAGTIDGANLDVSQSDIDEITEDVSGTTGKNNNPKLLQTNPEDLESETIRKVKRLAKNNDTFSRYWKGNIAEYNSRSEAEFAFIIKMLNHSFTKQQIIEVMWASGMSKWEEESDNYRDRTVERAIQYFDGTVVKDSKDGSFSF
jgi:hypothetical protein